MTYQPGIPTGSVPLNQDYINLQNNFSQLNTQFLVDHVPLTSTSGVPPNGYHESVHLVPVSTVASNPPSNQPINGITSTGGYGQVLNAQINDGINTDEALFFLSGGNKLIQLTRNFNPTLAVNGATCLPGGLILNWGNITLGATGVFPITFTQKFPKAVYSIVGLGQTNSSPTNNAFIVQSSVTTSGFSLQNFSASLTNFNWIAIGA